MRQYRRMLLLFAFAIAWLSQGAGPLYAAPTSPSEIASTFLTTSSHRQREALMTSSFRGLSQFFPPPARAEGFFAKVKLVVPKADPDATTLELSGTGTHPRYKQPIKLSVSLKREKTGAAWRVDEMAIVKAGASRGWGALLVRKSGLKARMAKLKRGWGMRKLSLQGARLFVRHPKASAVLQFHSVKVNKRYKRREYRMLLGWDRKSHPHINDFGLVLRDEKGAAVSFGRMRRSTGLPAPYYGSIGVITLRRKMKKPALTRLHVRLSPQLSRKAPRDCVSFAIDKKNQIQTASSPTKSSLKLLRWALFEDWDLEEKRYSNQKLLKTYDIMGKLVYVVENKKRANCKPPKPTPGKRIPWHRRCRGKERLLIMFGHVPSSQVRRQGKREAQFKAMTNGKPRSLAKRASFEFFRFGDHTFFFAKVKSWPFGEPPFKSGGLCFSDQALLAKHTHEFALSLTAPASKPTSRPTSRPSQPTSRAVSRQVPSRARPRPTAPKARVAAKKPAVAKKRPAPARPAAAKDQGKQVFSSVLQQMAYDFLQARTNVARAAFVTQEIAAMLRQLPAPQRNVPLYRDFVIKAEVSKPSHLKKIFGDIDTRGKIAIYGEGFVGRSQKRAPFVLLFRRVKDFWLTRTFDRTWEIEEAYLRDSSGVLMQLHKSLKKLFAWLKTKGFGVKASAYHRRGSLFVYAYPLSAHKPHNFAVMYNSLKHSSVYLYIRGGKHHWRRRRWTWRGPLPGYGDSRLKLVMYQMLPLKTPVKRSMLTLELRVYPRFRKKNATTCFTLPRPAMNQTPADVSAYSTKLLRFYEGGYYRADKIDERRWSSRQIFSVIDINGKRLYLSRKTPPNPPKKKGQHMLFGVSAKVSDLAAGVPPRDHFYFYVNRRMHKAERSPSMRYNGRVYFYLGWERSAFFGIRKEFTSFELCYFAPKFAARKRQDLKFKDVPFDWPTPPAKRAKAPAKRATAPAARRKVPANAPSSARNKPSAR